ncbi:MAG: bifunctional folylpolyglutamate synthase/dihydrofolate synthase, partial [Lachnospiraceae bacterium]|nr:bifunctional folylpolyglutamate synthase/dihydrofolate synthase [Lachnospiraceae bacterium]
MICKDIKTFEEAGQYLYDTPRFTSKHTIEETRAFLKKLGNPDLSFKIIHVAGTNGKGSTCAYLDSVLGCAGIKT